MFPAGGDSFSPLERSVQSWEYTQHRGVITPMPITWSPDTYLRTYRFAAQAHLGQMVPGTPVSYIMHLSFVSMEVIPALAADAGRDGDLAVQCALLHDVIEDTQVTYAQVEAEFGAKVALGVLALTKDAALDKPLQMPDSLRRIRQQPYEIWMVKLADRISNLAPPPDYWTKDEIARYREEALEIHAALHPASDLLARRLLEKIEAYRAYL
jgi:(p)ppGpp synthase/HD superfamily hydrolase